MRIAAISDMHGNAVAFEAVIQDLKQQSPDEIVCLGDIVMRGPQPKECVELLRELNPSVTVRGNYDHLFTRWPKPDWQPSSYKEELALRAMQYDCERLSQADQEWLGSLPIEASITREGLRIDLFHASPTSLTQYTWPWTSDEELSTRTLDESTGLVLFGHMHRGFIRQVGRRVVVNTGSIGSPFDGDARASYAIIDLSGGDSAAQLRRVTYDVERAIAIARERQMPDLDAFEFAVRNARYPYSSADRS